MPAKIDKPIPILGNVYTLNEAASKLHMSRRALQDTIKRLPHYAKNGRVYLFSDDDILKIWEGMREESNERRKELERLPHSGGLMGGRSPELRKLLAAPKTKRKGRPSSNLQRQIAEAWQRRDPKYPTRK